MNRGIFFCSLRNHLFTSRSPFGALRRVSAQATASYTLKDDDVTKALPFEEIPGLSRFELLKRFLPGGKFRNLDLIKIQQSMRSELGDFYRLPGMFGQTEILTLYDPKDVEFVHRNEGIYPFRRGMETMTYFRENIRKDVYGAGGLIVDQGASWHKMRTAVNPILMQPKIVKSYIPLIDSIVNEFMDNIAILQDDNGEMPANFNEYLNRWSLESITAISLEKRLGLMNFSGRNEFGEKIAKTTQKIFRLGSEFEMKPTIWRWYETKAFKELMQAHNDLTDLSCVIIDEAVKKFENNEGDHNSVLFKLLQKSKNFAVVMAFDLILGGIDTTSSALSSIMYCLAKNPEKQKRLRQELMQIMPDKDSPLSGDNMKNMPYLRAVIKETLRLFPPAALNMRRTTEPIVIRGYHIPKNVDIVLGMMHIYKDESSFGNPNEFIPERWLRQQQEPDVCPQSMKQAHPFSYLPFGYGVRYCAGKRIAEMELETFTSRLFRNYKVEWNHPDLHLKATMVNVLDGPLRFKMTKL